jgi:hypothetical protein
MSFMAHLYSIGRRSDRGEPIIHDQITPTIDSADSRLWLSLDMASDDLFAYSDGPKVMP